MINSLLPLEPTLIEGNNPEVGLMDKTILYDGSQFNTLKDKCYLAVKKFEQADYKDSNVIGPLQISTLNNSETEENKQGCLFTTENGLNHIIVFNNQRLDNNHTSWYNTTVFFWNLEPIYITESGSFSILYSNSSMIYHSWIRLIPKDKIDSITEGNEKSLAEKIFEKVSDKDLPAEAVAATLEEFEQEGREYQEQQYVIQQQQRYKLLESTPQAISESDETEKNYEVISFPHVASSEYIYQAVPTSTITTEGWYYPVLCKKVDWLEFKFHQLMYVK